MSLSSKPKRAAFGRWLTLVSALCACGREDVDLGHPQSSVTPGTPDEPAGGPTDAADCSAEVPDAVLMPRPPMGWNGYNAFSDCSADLNEAKVHAVTDALVSSGMQSVGYQYVNLDKCSEVERSADGHRVLDPARFPGGIATLSAYIHERGLSFGVFAPTQNCLGAPGGEGHEAGDVADYTAWGVDYLKYVSCNPGAAVEPMLHQTMATALLHASRPIALSITNPPFAEWMAETAQLWRTGGNADPTWEWLVGAIDDAMPSAAYTRPGAFNDPDMLEVGNGALTPGETRVHFSVWSILAAPLLAGNDLTKMSEATRAVLTNTEVIALDQDPLALQGALVRREGAVDVLAKPLSECGARGVVLWNRATADSEITLNSSEIWLAQGPTIVRDLWSQLDLPPSSEGITVKVPGHDAVALRVVGREPPLPSGETFLSDLPWSYAVSGQGPVERDTSNGEAPALDGLPLRLRGGAYDKGLGVHAPSLIRYRLGRACSRLVADVGVDDETAGQGSIELEVWADGVKLFESGKLSGTTPAKHVDVDLTGKRDLRLFVGTAGDDATFDHADWAGARLSCRETRTTTR